MFDIYIKDFNQNGRLITTETLVQSIPSATQGELKLISPIVKAEMGNAEAFNFSIEGGTKFYDAFNQMKTFMRVVYDGDTIFYGRVLTIENGLTGTRKIRLEGPLAFLNDTSLEGTKESARPRVHVYDYLKSIIDNHNSMCDDSKRSFSLGEVPGNYQNASGEQKIKNASRKFGQDGWTDSKSAIEDLRSHYGGYLRVRCNGHANNNGTYTDQGHYLDWLNHYFNTSENSQTIEVGKNIIDISTSTEIDNIFTVVIPIGNSKTTSSTSDDGTKTSSGPKHFYVDGKEVTVPSICSVYGNELNSGYHTYDDYAQALNRYGRIIKTVTFDDAETPADLLVKCQEWIKNNYQGEVTKFTVKAVDMHQIGDRSISKIMVGDRVRIIYPVAKEDGSVEKVSIVRTCLSIQYDLYNPENNSYTFGIPANILTKSYGVTKQGKKAQDPSTTPKSVGGTGSTRTVAWIDKVLDWLQVHMIWYRHLNATQYDPNVEGNSQRFPWKVGMNTSNTEFEKGPYGSSERYKNRFLHTSTGGIIGAGFSNAIIWKFVPTGQSSPLDEHTIEYIKKQIADSMLGADPRKVKEAQDQAIESYTLTSSHQSFSRSEVIVNVADIDSAMLIKYHIIDYVKYEYGFDLTNFEGVRMPDTTITNEDGTSATYGASDNGLVTKEMFRAGYNGAFPSGWHIVMRYDGKEVYSCQDENGNWTYWTTDSNGNPIPTTVRDLTLTKLDSDKAFGSMIQEGLMTPDGEVYTYLFAHQIENYKNGELVVAHAEGDVTYIGYGPKSNPQKSYYTSVASLRHMDSVAGNVHYEPDENGVMQLVLDYAGGVRVRRGRRDENGNLIEDADGNVIYGEFGVYDKDNLTGGMIVEMINGETTTRITGDHIKIGETQDGGVTKDIVISAKDSSQVGIVDLDKDGNPVLSAGTKVWRTKDGQKAAFGLWDSSGDNIDAGIMIEKINNHTTTKISGDVIYLQGETLAETMYSCDFDGGTITGLTGLNSKSYLNLKQGSHIRLANFSTSDKTHHTSATPYSANSEELADNMIVNAYFEGGSTYHVLNFKHLSGDTLSINFNDSNHTLTVTDRFDHKITFRSYVGGWDAAYSKVSYPTTESNSSSMIAITVPPQEVDGNTLTRSYTMDYHATDKNIEILKYWDSDNSEYITVARHIHNRYNLGWNTACDKISYPTTESTSSSMIALSLPEKNKVDTTPTTKSYTLLAHSTNKNIETLNYWDSSTEKYVVVAQRIHNRYNGGWNAACDKISYPTTESTSSSMIALSLPVKNSVDGSPVTKSYTLLAHSTNNNIETLNYWDSSKGTYIIVAQRTHNKYTAGWNAAVADSNITTYATYADGTELPYGVSLNVSAAIKKADGTSKSIIGRNYTTKPDRYNTGYDASHSMYLSKYSSSSSSYVSISDTTISAGKSITVYPSFDTKAGGQQRGPGIKFTAGQGTTYENSRDFFYWYDDTWIDPDGQSRKHNVWYTQYYAAGSSSASNHPGEDVGYEMHYGDTTISWRHR